MNALPGCTVCTVILASVRANGPLMCISVEIEHHSTYLISATQFLVNSSQYYHIEFRESGGMQDGPVDQRAAL